MVGWRRRIANNNKPLFASKSRTATISNPILSAFYNTVDRNREMPFEPERLPANCRFIVRLTKNLSQIFRLQTDHRRGARVGLFSAGSRYNPLGIMYFGILAKQKMDRRNGASCGPDAPAEIASPL